MLIAGLFLKEFVADGRPLGARRHRRAGLQPGRAVRLHPHGGTGAAVRTFVQLLEDLAAG